MVKKRRKKKGNTSGWRGAPTGGMGAGGMGNFMSQMTKMQEEMDKIQAELDQEELTVTAGGGMITVVITGGQEFRSIKIDPDAVDPDDVEMLEDMVLAAVNEAMQTSKAVQEERLGALTSGMGLPPGLGI